MSKIAIEDCPVGPPDCEHCKQILVRPGYVVQLDPDQPHGFFGGCLLMVTSVYGWGVQGFVSVPHERGKPPSQAYYRATWDTFLPIGMAHWIPEDEDEEDAE